LVVVGFLRGNAVARDFKLNKSDLPAALRYSRERFWVEERPGGTYRIGICMPAVQDDATGVYFLDIRRAGYIQTGKKLGTLDIDTGRFELMAPFSGRIVRANGLLKDDPGLVAVDCFGDGWLLDVNRVMPQAFGALLDRDSFHGWLKFEREARRLGLDPTLGCVSRIVEGEPWPQDIVFRFGGKVVLRSRPVKLGRNETFTPQWTTGQKWRVKTEFEQPSIAMVADAPNEPAKRLWEYTVVDESGEVDGEACTILDVLEIAPYPVQKRTLLSIAKSDFSLRLIEEVSTQDAGARARLPNDWGAELFMELRQPRELIVDLPLFPPENRAERRLVAVGEEPPVEVDAQFPTPRTRAIAMTAQTLRGTFRSEQTWERGLPWWRNARRLSGEKVLITGELVS
jgi:glycine cleavage system H protein